MIFKSDPHEFREPKPMQWPWPSPSSDQVKSLITDMQSMNQRLQHRIDELNFRLIHLEEVVREFHVQTEE